ncbi:metallophosphoesterase [Desulfoluna sp.]|uniref:metallophosphoesterase n=1 Tax=Desulfoluna sp. TaxID=2045199 RepID=UPI002613D067|nr:metallophosphoesterase [Desulfoluna sp.]
MLVPQYDAVHVISDIHLGGTQGFQIFNQQEALAWLVDHLATEPEDKKVALVLNGDIVDFLAEPLPPHAQECYFRPSHAITDLERIMEDPAFIKGWEALARFVQTPNRTLVVVLGNHDVELALPGVRECLASRLCTKNDGTPDDAARGRLLFAMDGTGFACRVETRNILCIHGNETDAWNPVDFHTLARISAQKKRHTPLTEWTPNAGTKMVIDVMNEMKRTYRWIDLLKPETETVPALLLAMDDKAVTWSRVKKLFGVAADYLRDRQRGPDHFLSCEREFSESEASEDQAFQSMMSVSYPSLAGPTAPDTTNMDATDMDLLLSEMDTHVAHGTSPAAFANDTAQPEFLGTWGAIWDKLRGRSPEENVREALLGWLKGDPTFDPTEPDATCEKVQDLIGSEVDVVVAGHTHLHKAIKMETGTTYFNSGSWIRLMQLPPDLLGKKPFKKVWAVLKKGDMESLDTAIINGRPLIRHIRSVVSIENEANGKVLGTLATVEESDAGYRLTPVPQGQLGC